ncbi:hypothetical protein MCAG_00755 [Micromonospora sp. ATCC 39149]|nr:hypothetical protein MCAG_00755 [Micromonospora sp. ATCC 39149]
MARLTLIQGLGVEGYGGLYQRLTIAVGWGWLAALAWWLRGPVIRVLVTSDVQADDPDTWDAVRRIGL